MDTQSDQDLEKLKQTILVTYHQYRSVPLSEIPPKWKLCWNQESKKTTALLNKAIYEIAESEHILDIMDISIFDYDVAISICIPINTNTTIK
eukprot:1148647-Ditylum_brightwellii.AAC.1